MAVVVEVADLEENCWLGLVSSARVSVVSLRLGTGVGHSCCSWLVVVVDSFGGDRVSWHHWEMLSRMVGRTACGVVSLGKSLMSLLRSAVRVAGQMANARVQSGLEEKSGLVWVSTRKLDEREERRGAGRMHRTKQKKVSNNGKEVEEVWAVSGSPRWWFQR